MSNMRQIMDTAVAVKLMIGATLAFGLPSAEDSRAVVVAQCEEDQACWDCATMGNRVCGPDNPQGMPAGRYDVDGVLVDPWPVS